MWTREKPQDCEHLIGLKIIPSDCGSILSRLSKYLILWNDNISCRRNTLTGITKIATGRPTASEKSGFRHSNCSPRWRSHGRRGRWRPEYLPAVEVGLPRWNRRQVRVFVLIISLAFFILPGLLFGVIHTYSVRTTLSGRFPFWIPAGELIRVIYRVLHI